MTAENASRLERRVVRTGEETFLTERDVSGGLSLMEDPAPVRLSCADWDQLAFLASGDVALTSRANANSGVTARCKPQ